MTVLANKRIRAVLAPLKTAAAAISATASVQCSTANGSDAATTQALANDLKVKYNAAQLEIADLRAKLNALTAAIDAL